MKFKDCPEKLGSKLKQAIRESFKQGSLYKEALNRARVEIPRYKKDGTQSKKNEVWHKCSKCEELFKQHKTKAHGDVVIVIDHIIPVVPHGTGKKWHDYEISDYISRVFCDIENLQALCSKCNWKKGNKK